MNIEQAKQVDFASFVEWATEPNKKRAFSILWNSPYNGGQSGSIYVYDHDIGGGQMVNSVDEIDIEAAKKADALRKLEEAQKTLGVTA